MLYVVRHGQTDWNAAWKIQGLTDIPLNEKGIEQANELKEKLKDIKFAKVFSSPLKRAKKTAEIIAGSENSIDIDKRLIERCMGDFEGKSPETLEDAREKIWNYKLNTNENNVEKVVDLTNRINNFLNEYKDLYENNDVLIVTHMNVLPAINAYFNGIPDNNQMTKRRLSNCEVITYEVNQ